ncbi:DUF1579 domain-containing protein [Planctomicrobium piriforme]|uniref:DUF1579 domain-containing protein n=1 Tax=Planctomicrobium piriforme TaxID=1576369 RepID=A0A1I3T2F8_9PLAN|nr:DUF1579 domain-containing protein [Planctomicrobium piriforme]SFJ65298.1 Protein of unknown function [Planctomicrobium piriforme]
MHVEPQPQHRWLQQLIGKWTFEVEANMGPDQPPMKHQGSEVVRGLGEIWILCEGQGEMPDGGIGKTIMTLGYDTAKQRFVGTFIGSMMTYMWPYDGELDADEKVLKLNSVGLNFEQTAMVNYIDTITIVTPDHRTLTSQIQQPDGTWLHFMTGHYHRQK